MKAQAEVDVLVRRSGGLISRRDHPALAHTMAWLVKQGKLVPVLPGIYAPPELAHSVEVLMRAVSLRHRTPWSVGRPRLGPLSGLTHR